MKNTMKTAAFAALALVFAVSCAKETELAPEKEGGKLHFTVNTAANALVKSYLDNNLDGTYTPKWSKGDGIAVFTGSIVESTKPDGTLYNQSADGTTASFDGTLASANEGVFKAISPAGSFAKAFAPDTDGAEFVGVALGDPDNNYVQNPTNVTIDPNCDILVSKSVSYASDGSNVVLDDIYFKRVMSVVKINLNAPASYSSEKVKNLTMTSSAAPLGGRAKIDITNAKVVDWTVSNKSVKAAYAEENDMPVLYDADNRLNSVYLVVNPTTLAAGTTLTFSGETDNCYLSKEVTLPADIVFPESQIAVINLTLAEANLTNKVSTPTYNLHTGELVEGDYLIVYGGKAMKAVVSSNRFGYVEVTASDNAIQTSDESIVWHIEESGDYWTIFNDGVQKFAAGNGTKNQAQLLVSGSDDQSLWTATKSSDAFEFVNKANKAKSVNANLRGNGNNGFACYGPGTGGALSLYKFSGTTDIHKVSIASGIENGTLTASHRRAKEGTEITLTATPFAGYEFNDDWTVKDADDMEISVTGGKFTMPAKDVTVSGSFSKPAETPVITLDGADATITCATEGATIHYTVGESPADPTESDAVYSSPVTLTDGQTIKAMAVKDGMRPSAVAFMKYIAGAKYYVKVTAAPSDWTGTYQLAHPTTAGYVYSVVENDWIKLGTNLTDYDNSLDRYVSTATSDGCAIVIESVTDGYVIKIGSSYVYCSAAKKVALDSTHKTVWTISVSDGFVTFKNSKVGTLYFNSTGLRPYTSTSNNYSLPKLYKLSE